MGRVAFLFSGQGSQYTGMGLELAKCSESAAKVFEFADSIRPGTSKQCFEGTDEELVNTRNTQPCLFCVDLAAAEALRERGIAPDYLAGFSLGEIPALAFGGYIPLEEAFKFIIKRAEYMDDCGKKYPGTMYAVIGLKGEDVEKICSMMEGCYPVNYNLELQTVVSCTVESANDFPKLVSDHGGKALKLAVSGGFHSPMMTDARTRLESEFKDMSYKEGKIPVFANVTGEIYEGREQLFEQINSPVLWHRLILNLNKHGVDTFVEVGPGKTLSNMVKKILGKVKILNVEDEKSLIKAQEELTNAER
ncbi:MAG: ACP S-malonyltransferase [Clostridiales bacterium]|nr:ACP S-malonyltransferase [Clostridiales bacterium]